MKTRCETYTRCVGYLRPIDSMNDSKQAEVKDRFKFDSKDNLYKQTTL
jgi:anaerobic ribonucleoside-triphosphate reductase